MFSQDQVMVMSEIADPHYNNVSSNSMTIDHAYRDKKNPVKTPQMPGSRGHRQQ